MHTDRQPGATGSAISTHSKQEKCLNQQAEQAGGAVCTQHALPACSQTGRTCSCKVVLSRRSMQSRLNTLSSVLLHAMLTLHLKKQAGQL